MHAWCFAAQSRLGLYPGVLLLEGGLGAAQPSWGARAVLQLGSEVPGSDQLLKEPR